MVELIGSEKQVSWAVQIRAEVIVELEKIIVAHEAKQQNMLSVRGKRAKMYDRVIESAKEELDRMNSETLASSIIDKYSVISYRTGEAKTNVVFDKLK